MLWCAKIVFACETPVFQELLRVQFHSAVFDAEGGVPDISHPKLRYNVSSPPPPSSHLQFLLTLPCTLYTPMTSGSL